MQSRIAMVVHEPPFPSLPYLAVAIFPDGEIVATPYPTSEEAEKYVTQQVGAGDHIFRN